MAKGKKFERPLTEQEKLQIVTDRVNEILEAVDDLTKSHVLVGVTENTNNRQGGTIGNAALAYIHNYGSGARGIPPRPFLEPGIKRVQKAINEAFLNAGRAAIAGNKKRVTAFLTSAGFIAVESIKSLITSGIPPPLKAKSVAGRRRARGTKSIRPAEIFYKQEFERLRAEEGSAAYAERVLFNNKYKNVDKTPHYAAGTPIPMKFVLDPEGARLATPLINTGQLLNSITFVITHDNE